MRRCTTRALAVTCPSKLATSSSPITHADTTTIALPRTSGKSHGNGEGFLGFNRNGPFQA
jgi:hypothetical protein